MSSMGERFSGLHADHFAHGYLGGDPVSISPSSAPLRQAAELRRPPLTPQARSDRLPLSFAQQRLWFLERLGVGVAYNESMAITLTGGLNLGALERALRELISRHESLRTRFEEWEGFPYQIIDLSADASLEITDLRTLELSARRLMVRAELERQLSRHFDLSRGSLCRQKLLLLGEEEQALLFTIHHIVADGWSMEVIKREFEALYEAFRRGRNSPLPGLPLQYADYAIWQRGWLQGAELQRQLDYWKGQLANLGSLSLPVDRGYPSVPTFKGALLSFSLSEDLTTKLTELARGQKVTLYVLLLGAFQCFLARLSGQQDIVVASPIAGRTHWRLENLVGFFVNTLVMRTSVQSSVSFTELLPEVNKTVLGAIAHQDIPFEELVAELHPERARLRQPIFQVVFAWQHFTQERVQATSKFDLSLYMQPAPDGLQCEFEYATDLFDESTIRRFGAYWVRLLDEITSAPESPLWRLPLLSEDDRQRILAEWNHTRQEFSDDKGIHELFSEQTRRTPHALALICGSERVTYQGLDARSDRLANELRTLGAAPEVVVGLCMDRSTHAVVGLLGILKAGAAYLPLASEDPDYRIRELMGNAGVRIVVTRQRLLGRLRSIDPAAQLCALDGSVSADCTSVPHRTLSLAGQLAYVLYTSGSSGPPRAVAVSHRAVTRLVKNPSYVDLSGAKHVLCAAPFAFDASTFEVWAPLLNGGCLLILTERVPTAEAIARLIAEHGIDIAWLTASLFNGIVDIAPQALAGIRQLLIGGEALSVPHVTKATAALSGTTLINGYGPTECVTFSCSYAIPRDLQRPLPSGIPIGRPIQNASAYVLDEGMEPVPIGVTGELYIGGLGLARGYLDKPMLTVEHFVTNPFGNGTRLYRTGDHVRHRPDGNLEFLGRLDEQVKIRGHRIELGEIESTLQHHRLVRRAVVAVRECSSGEKRLTAYVVANSERLRTLHADSYANVREEVVDQWCALYDEQYRGDILTDAPTFVGWNSSYTGEPLSSSDMQEWLDATVDRISAWQPKKVLELGCGVGLLIRRLAPRCEVYRATDFSQGAILRMRRWLSSEEELRHVEVSQGTAAELEEFPSAEFDTVLLNSVVQYFPDIEYLLTVIERAVRVVGRGGRIFIGDVRNLALMPLFHSGVQLDKTSSDTSVEQLRFRIGQAIEQDKELVIDPEFFRVLPGHIPSISSVEIQLKRGRSHNELTCYRYDVVLHIGTAKAAPLEKISWQSRSADLLGELATFLKEYRPASLRIGPLPNARLARDRLLLHRLEGNESGSLDTLRRGPQSPSIGGIDPEELWRVGEAHGYEVTVTWAAPDAKEGALEADLTDRCPAQVTRAAPASVKEPPARFRPWDSYSHNPLTFNLSRIVIQSLREFLESRLPEYMLPTSIIVMKALPLTANGKIDRRRLPVPDARLEVAEFSPPHSSTEQGLATIWMELLQLDRVGANDDFFHLGGHSLLAMRVAWKVRERFTVELTLRAIFERSTLRDLAAYIDLLKLS